MLGNIDSESPQLSRPTIWRTFRQTPKSNNVRSNESKLFNATWQTHAAN